MSFLSPGAIAIASALTIPPLVALYFLKLKRTVKAVPSTLLWKKSVEDLQVNSPFQRLRSSLLLLLQLLVLIAGAVALGKPMFQTAERSESTVIILIDQSASMAVVEADGRTRLDAAKEQAKRAVDNMPDDSRAMVIAFCDRATVESSFDSDKEALKQKIDSIVQTDSRSSLTEAVGLAEAYAQNITIGTEEAGGDIAPESSAPPATVYLFTDGRIAGADEVTIQRLSVQKIRLTTVGSRDDNAGITAMSARRNYERPEILEVVATVRNFGGQPAAFDAVLYVNGINADIKPVRLGALAAGDGEVAGPSKTSRGSTFVVAFDPIEFTGAGAVEVLLRTDDALPADDRAWTVIDPPRRLKILLVTDGGLFLENVLSALSIDLSKMTRDVYEEIADEAITESRRSSFDVVFFDRHSTSRLPQGNYFFWGGVPLLDDVSIGRVIDDEVIFDWDDTHPVLRHVSIETLEVLRWFELALPPEARPIIDGQTSPVLSYLTRDASQYLISAFSPIVETADGDQMMNTYWVASPDFVVFMQNSIHFLASSLAAIGKRTVAPGEPITLRLRQSQGNVRILRPDGVVDEVQAAGLESIHYARTRRVGIYRVDGEESERNVFAVNLFDPIESHVAPTSHLTLSAESVVARTGEVQINHPAWPYLLLFMLVLIIIEWIVYNQRVFV